MPKKPSPQDQDDWQFGVNWTKSGMAGLPEFARRMKCARYGIGDTSRAEHRKAVIQTLWPENIYSWHYWMERRLKSVCENNFVTWIGPASSGKTSDAAILGLEYWLEAPHETAVICCSTTKQMLRKRIWGEIVKYHGLLPESMGYKGELLDASTFIRWKDGDWKHGIHGVAVDDGPPEEAVNNIVGVHAKRIWWILDEMQGVKEAIMKAIPNLLKNPESKMLGMGNPDLLTSLLCRYSIPIEGWDSIIPKVTEEWETRSNGYKGKGKCLFFDGRLSPACLDPEWGKTNDWMINQDQIRDHLSEVNGNDNDPAFMTQSIGWPPSMGIEATILDNAILTTFKCHNPVVWTDGWTAFGALDPAFNGGDRAILQFGKRGFVRDSVDGDRWVIWFETPKTVPMDGERKDRPIHYQILDYCRAQCEERNIKPTEFAIASAGEGGGLKAIFDQEWGVVNGIEEGGSASERQIETGKTAKQAYDNRSSELAFGLREMALANGIRGLGVDAADQCCKRQTFYRNGKWCVEPKRGSKGRTDSSGHARKGFKERLGYSPDHQDSCNIAVEHCRMKGAYAGSTQRNERKDDDWNKQLVKEDAAFSEQNYIADQDWQAYA